MKEETERKMGMKIKKNEKKERRGKRKERM